jgi:hypothetical protein
VRREEAAAGGGIVGLREEREGEGPGCNYGKVLRLMLIEFCKLCASGEGLVVIIEKWVCISGTSVQIFSWGERWSNLD